MISADVKADVKQQELVALSYNFLVPSKLKWQRKTDIYFLFNIACHSTNLTLSIRKRGLGGFSLNRQNLLSMPKVIWQSLICLRQLYCILASIKC